MANTKIPAELSSTPSISDSASATAITIDSSGNVGIGGSPSAKLDVNTGTTNTLAHFHSTDDNAFIEIKDDDTQGYIGVQNDYLYVGSAPSNNAQNINIHQTTGKVGIGETSPLGMLHVKTADSSGTADSGADELILENSGDTGMTILSGTSNSGSIRFGDSDDNDNGIIIYNHGSSPYMRFFIGGSEVLQLGTSYIYINGGNGQTFSDYVRTYSKSQGITFSSSTSSTSTTLSGYLTYQFMIDCTFHMGYVGNGAISTHIRVSLCNTYSGLSVSTLHTAYGQSHNSYHTFSISGTGNYNTRQLVITCNPQSGQNASNAAGNAYYGMGV